MKKLLYIVLFALLVNKSYAFIENSNFYGYGQIDYSIAQKGNTKSSFDIVRFNIIGDIQLSPQARFISDIELEDNTFMGPKGNIGSIKFSQFWVEYSFLPEIKLRAGKFLTNFGLYNKIHDASPTYFSIAPPLLYNRFQPNIEFDNPQRFFGKYLMGSELTGTVDLGHQGSQFEYSLMFGNGRNDYVDTTYISHNTALAGRLLFRPEFISGFHIGTSFYTDINEIGMGGVHNSRELTIGVEAQYEYQALQIQSEIMLAKFKNLSNEDQKAILTYVQLAYTFKDLLTPYIQLNYLKFNQKNDDAVALGIFGLNYAISNQFFIKTEAQYNYKSMMKNVVDFGAFKASLSLAF